MDVPIMPHVGLKLDGKTGEPIYRQLFDQIVARIQSRAFPPGYKLPPTRTLAELLGTHRNTVARAYADLEAAGFVASSVGRGTFVEERAPENVARGEAGAPSPTRAMPWASLLSRGARPDVLHRAERYASHPPGKDVVNLTRMQPSPDLIPHELMRRCIDRVLKDLGSRAMTYAPPQGVMRLREQVALDLGSRGIGATADDVLITSGSQQAIDILTRALVNPGEAVLVDTTTYSGAIDVFALGGARLLPVGQDAHGPDMGALRRLARSDVKALYLMPNGHNPTGRTTSAERRRELTAWSRASGIPLIEDDYGAGLVLDDSPSPPYLRALDGDVLHLSTYSKRLIPALRIGFVVCPPAMRAPLVSLKRVLDLGTSAVLQHALAEFMERGYLRAHTSRVVAEYRIRRDALESALSKAMPADSSWQSPSHGVVLWLRLPAHIDSVRVHEEALREGVLVSPSPMWSAEARVEPGLRLAFSSEPPKRIREGIKRLGRAVEKVLRESPRNAPTPTAIMEVVSTVERRPTQKPPTKAPPSPRRGSQRC